MRIDFKKLRKIPVETESGVELGNIVEVELDAEKHVITKYFVDKSKIFSGNELSIAPSQVVSINAEIIIVEDSICREEKSTENVREYSGVETPAISVEIK